MYNIVCVLKTGKFNKHQNTNKPPVVVDYGATIVPWLKRQVERHVTVPHRFVCMTNVEEIPGVEVIPLEHDWDGWWSKLEIFKKGRFEGTTLYIDLDTVILQNIDDLLTYDHKFTTLDNISHPNSGDIGAGLMAWKDDYSYLYDLFASNPEKYMKECITSRNWGDQGFIKNNLGFDPARFQHTFPGIHSLRRELSDGINLEKGKPKEDTRIVIFNADPKPWDMTEDWIPQ